MGTRRDVDHRPLFFIFVWDFLIVARKRFEIPFQEWYYLSRHGTRFPVEAPNASPTEITTFVGATITEAKPDYIGSISLPDEWFEKGYVLNGQLVFVTPFCPRTGEPLHGQVMCTYAIREPDLTYEQLVDEFWNAFQTLSEKDTLADAIKGLLSIDELLTKQHLQTKIRTYTQESPEEAFEAFQEALSKKVTPYPILMFHKKFRGIRANGGAALVIEPKDQCIISSFGYPIKGNHKIPGPIYCVQLNASNDIMSVKTTGTFDLEELLIPMFGGKIHRVVPFPVTDQSPDSLQQAAGRLDQKEQPTLLIGSDLAAASGFQDGDLVDALPINRIYEESKDHVVGGRVRCEVEICDVPGHFSIHGLGIPEWLNQADNVEENRFVLIKYVLMLWGDAVECADSFTTVGFPFLAIVDDGKTKEDGLNRLNVGYSNPMSVEEMRAQFSGRNNIGRG